MRIFPPLRRILRFWRSRSCWTTARRLCTKRGSDETRGLGFLKVARGRSWRPESGMEHASRDRRSGNEGVGARWRGRFRIFSARHCSRTKVSHAENSGMTMLFFSWGLLRCRRGILSQAQERPATHAAAGAAARGSWVFAAARGVRGILLRLDWEPLRGHGLTTGVVRHACRHRVTARGVFVLGDSFTRSGALIRRRRAAGETRRVLMRVLFF